MGALGIRREDKSVWERRVPLVPADVARLVQQGVRVLVQKSPNRCFADAEFADAGAELVDDLGEATAILGVKEIPVDRIDERKTYVFFSHTMKGQSYNMPMLRTLLDRGCTMLDYELVTDEDGLRTIAFGRFAGLAGAIDTLWALGRRFAAEGLDTPLAALKQSLDYRDLEEACAAVRAAGERIAAGEWPEAAPPLVIAVTGEGGKVFGGAVEILKMLPAREVPAEQVAEAAAAAGRREVLIVPYGPGNLVEPKDATARYEWEDYLHHPEKYQARFGRDLHHFTAIVHGVFWTEGYPRFILREDVVPLWKDGAVPALRVVTDITCDPDGSNELLLELTEPGDPAYVVDPDSFEASHGFEGRGPVVLAVDILPAELPRDASAHFSAALVDVVAPLAADGAFDTPDDASIDGSLRRSLMVWRGRLVEPWDERLADALAQHGGGA